MDHHEKRCKRGYPSHSYLGTELLTMVYVPVLPLAEAGMSVHVLLNLSFTCLSSLNTSGVPKLSPCGVNIP